MFAAPFDISDVADLLSVIRLESKEEEFDVVCPFCGDRRGKMNFCVYKDGKLKNTYHCFDCGAGGNMLTLYAELKGIYGENRYKEAYREIKESLQLSKGKVRERRQFQKRQVQEKARKAAVAADYINRDIVYREMIKLLRLTGSHKKNLLARGLDSRMVSHMEQKGYKSTDYLESEAIARKLIKQGLSLEGVPGFFVNRKGNWEAAFYKGNAGYLCPVWSEDGMLIGFQIRLDHPYKKRKYVWFTSSGLKKGCSSGSPVGISGSPDVKSICVTEGILKGEITHQFTGRTFLENPGVGNHAELKRMLQKLKDRGLEEVCEFYDMDKNMSLICRQDYDKTCRFCEWKDERNGDGECPRKREKRDNIRKGCNKLYQICDELSLQCIREIWDQSQDGTWAGNYKGVDDWEAKGFQGRHVGYNAA